MLVAVSRAREPVNRMACRSGQRRGGDGWFGPPLDSAGVGVHYFANDKTIGNPP